MPHPMLVYLASCLHSPPPIPFVCVDCLVANPSMPLVLLRAPHLASPCCLSPSLLPQVRVPAPQLSCNIGHAARRGVGKGRGGGSHTMDMVRAQKLQVAFKMTGKQAPMIGCWRHAEGIWQHAWGRVRKRCRARCFVWVLFKHRYCQGIRTACAGLWRPRPQSPTQPPPPQQPGQQEACQTVRYCCHPSWLAQQRRWRHCCHCLEWQEGLCQAVVGLAEQPHHRHAAPAAPGPAPGWAAACCQPPRPPLPLLVARQGRQPLGAAPAAAVAARAGGRHQPPRPPAAPPAPPRAAPGSAWRPALWRAQRSAVRAEVSTSRESRLLRNPLDSLKSAGTEMRPDSWRSYTGMNLRRSSPV